MTGTLVLAATPIGDARDASPRLVEELSTAPVVAAEDTRRLRGLCERIGVSMTGRVISYHEHNEAHRTADLVELLLAGERVLLVTDAGMPSVSDPGYRLVSEAAGAGIPVTCVPGPSAVLMALAVSGLPVNRFCFEGFLPRKPGPRRKVVAELTAERRTMVFFEAPHRLGAMLQDLAQGFGEHRQAAVCRELTKTYEEVKRGALGDLARWAAEGVRGEITIVVCGAPESPAPEIGTLVSTIADRVTAGERLKDVCRDVSLRTGIGAKSLYDAAIAAKSDPRR